MAANAPTIGKVLQCLTIARRSRSAPFSGTICNLRRVWQFFCDERFPFSVEDGSSGDIFDPNEAIKALDEAMGLFVVVQGRICDEVVALRSNASRPPLPPRCAIEPSAGIVGSHLASLLSQRQSIAQIVEAATSQLGFFAGTCVPKADKNVLERIRCTLTEALSSLQPTSVANPSVAAELRPSAQDSQLHSREEIAAKFEDLITRSEGEYLALRHSMATRSDAAVEALRMHLAYSCQQLEGSQEGAVNEGYDAALQQAVEAAFAALQLEATGAEGELRLLSAALVAEWRALMEMTLRFIDTERAYLLETASMTAAATLPSRKPAAATMQLTLGDILRCAASTAQKVCDEFVGTQPELEELHDDVAHEGSARVLQRWLSLLRDASSLFVEIVQPLNLLCSFLPDADDTKKHSLLARELVLVCSAAHNIWGASEVARCCCATQRPTPMESLQSAVRLYERLRLLVQAQALGIVFPSTKAVVLPITSLRIADGSVESRDGHSRGPQRWCLSVRGRVDFVTANCTTATAVYSEACRCCSGPPSERPCVVF